MAQYKDIDFSFSKNPFSGDLNTVSGSTAIKQSLKNIILTYKGEKTFNYEFGASVQDVLFEPGNIPNIEVLSEIDVRIRTSEPRIDLKTVNYNISSATPEISIEYEYSLDNGDVATETTNVTTT